MSNIQANPIKTIIDALNCCDDDTVKIIEALIMTIASQRAKKRAEKMTLYGRAVA